MNSNAQKVGLIVFAIGVLDVALMLWMPMTWKYLVSHSSEISSFPLFTASPNPLALWLQSVFVGVILVVGGAFIYTKRAPVFKGLVLTGLSVLFTLLSMVLFSSQDYTLSLITFVIAIVFFAV
jgi:hypothetical protein